jgi:hypothetical protein
MDDSLRVKVGVAAAAALSLWGVIEYFGFETAYQRQYRDPYKIAAQAARLEGARATVPEDAILGYLTDLEQGSAAASALFNGAQYALAPRILRQDTARTEVLGNFTRPEDYAALGRQHGLVVERDFGNGVVLFRKEPAK